MKQPTAKTTQDEFDRNDDQDSAWKEMLHEFFPAFLAFFFPEIDRDVDWSRKYEPLDKELAEIKPNLPGGKLYADKLFKVWLKNGKVKWILIHVEVQGRAGRGFARRVFVYNYRIGERYPGEEVVSLAVITETKRPVENRYDVSNWGCSLAFSFPVVQIANYAARWAELETDRNPFAVAVMAQLKSLETRRDNRSRFAWKRQLVIGLYERGYNRNQVVTLFKFMDWVMRLPKELEQLYRQAIHDIEEGKKVPYITSLERLAIEDGLQEGRLKGIQEGLQEGRQEGRQDGLQEGLLTSVTLQLSHRFGELSNATQSKLRKLTLEQLRLLIVTMIGFETKADLFDWLKQQPATLGSPQKKNGKQTKRKHQ